MAPILFPPHPTAQVPPSKRQVLARLERVVYDPEALSREAARVNRHARRAAAPAAGGATGSRETQTECVCALSDLAGIAQNLFLPHLLLLRSAPRCAICLDAFVPRQLLRRVGCPGAHLFHDRCISEWVATGDPRCPMCR